jgi:hypothetical protein
MVGHDDETVDSYVIPGLGPGYNTEDCTVNALRWVEEVTALDGADRHFQEESRGVVA